MVVADVTKFDLTEKKSEYGGTVKIIIGGAWGDEGKGKIASKFSENADLVIRGNGGANAGHSVQHGSVKMGLHLIPGGIVYENPICLLGQGMVVDLKQLLDEIKELESAGVPNVRERLKIAFNVTLVFPFHKLADRMYETFKAHSIGTTGRGIGPAYASHANRDGIRFIDLFRPREEVIDLLNAALKPLNTLFTEYGFERFDNAEEIADEFMKYASELSSNIEFAPGELVYDYYTSGKNIVIEGAQAFRLDKYDPDYPNNTSSDTIPPGLLRGAHCTQNMPTEIVAVYKAHYSRVGNGPFITELPAHIENDKVIPYNEPFLGDVIREEAHEYGVSTGRPRRVGWFDAVIAKDAVKAMHADYLCINHLDTLGIIGEKCGAIKLCERYKYCGESITSYPTDMCLTKVIPEPIYGEIKGGWKITPDMKTYESLPKKARRFIEVIELITGVPVKYIGTGPENDDLIIR